MKKGRRKKKRICESKIQHKIQKNAYIAMNRTLQRHFIFHRLRVYKCEYCGNWHVGRTKEILYDRFSELKGV
jgi:hypothetical protein